MPCRALIIHEICAVEMRKGILWNVLNYVLGDK